MRSPATTVSVERDDQVSDRHAHHRRLWLSNAEKMTYRREESREIRLEVKGERRDGAGGERPGQGHRGEESVQTMTEEDLCSENVGLLHLLCILIFQLSLKV